MSNYYEHNFGRMEQNNSYQYNDHFYNSYNNTQNSMIPNNYNGHFQYNGFPMQYNNMNPVQGNYYNNSKSLPPFQNPLQPNEKSLLSNNMIANYYNMNKYPTAQLYNEQQTGSQTLINSFKNGDGTLDFNKMISTASNMMSTISEASTVVKGITSMFK